MRIKLHNLIFTAMVGGLLVGIGLWMLGKREDSTSQAVCAEVLWWLDLFGPTIFMGALKMIIAPLILASIISGVTSLPDMKELGAIGWKTLVYYVCTTTIAVAIGLVFVLTIQPGKRAASMQVRQKRIEQLEDRRQEYQEVTGQSALTDDGKPKPGYLGWLA